eukprot:CAMPEP_0206265228 /NCGR_PEP_ID=MMETSP0047_2-20121206/29867_1 /ASSEMBLY_ACC=CAM_ASM_000192 /TAXON_ID=195065 /ORGANISM="Chroomonas mesostigmatica_cf, Strain CCMP1168" /LENGTH=43 /DNA_ID= /DNA_START= /DNA_END= /DNA_ORIENTATION=
MTVEKFLSSFGASISEMKRGKGGNAGERVGQLSRSNTWSGGLV